MEPVFEVFGRYVSPRARPLFAAFLALLALTVFFASPFAQGLLLPMPRLWATTLVAVIGALCVGGVYYQVRQGEEAKAETARIAKLNRLALTATYGTQPGPDNLTAGGSFHVFHMGSDPSVSGLFGMNLPVVGGLWLKCVIRNVGEERLQDITLTYVAQFFRGGQLKPASIVKELRYPVEISVLPIGQAYEFYIVNPDTLNLSIRLPEGASVRAFGEPQKEGVRVQRAPESGWTTSNVLLPGGEWGKASPEKKPK